MLQYDDLADAVPEVAAADTPQEQVVRECYEQLADARLFRKQFDKDWPRFYLIYAGQHWDGTQADWQSTPVINLTKGFIQSLVPILTDRRPQIQIIPRKMEFEQSARVINDIIEWLWEQRDLDVLLPQIMTNVMVFGNGFCKVLWDPSLAEGKGDIRVVPVDSVNMFVSPFSRTLEEAEFIIHAENMPRGMVSRTYGIPLPKEEFGNGPEDPSLLLKRNVTSQISEGTAQGIIVASTDGSSAEQYNMGTGQGSYSDQADVVTVLERFSRMPQGGIEQTVIVNDKLLLKRPYPIKMYPFVHFVDMPHTWALWAEGEVQQVEKLQIEINRRRGHMMDILNFSASPMFAYDPSAVEDGDKIVARPGLSIPVDGGPQNAGWIQPANFPSAMFELNAADKADFDIILGNPEVMQGRRPAGIEAGVAIELLQDAASVRVGQKLRYMEASLRKLGQIMCQFIQTFYDTQRVFIISGRSASRMESAITMDGAIKQIMQSMEAGENPMADAMRPSSMKEMTINQPTGGELDPQGNPVMQMANRIPRPMDAEFDVRVGAGSTMPVSKVTQFQKSITLFQLGVIDDQELLKNSGLPHWEEVYERTQMKKMMAMQAQQAQMNAESDAAAPAEDPSAELGEEPEPTDQDLDDEFGDMSLEE